MNPKIRRPCAQLVGELLAHALRDARPQPPTRDRSTQQIARIGRRLRRLGLRIQPLPEFPPTFEEFLAQIDEEIERDKERERLRSKAEELRRQRDRTDEKRGRR